MTIRHQIATDDLPPGWETYHCTAGSCAQGLVQVARRSRGEDVWLIYERPGWVMAATAPVCPACGTTLTKEPSHFRRTPGGHVQREDRLVTESGRRFARTSKFFPNM